MDNAINISLEEYNELNNVDVKSNIFITAIENAARLDYTGKKLSFDDSVIDTILKILYPGVYNRTLSRLQEQKAADDLFNKGE